MPGHVHSSALLKKSLQMSSVCFTVIHGHGLLLPRTQLGGSAAFGDSRAWPSLAIISPKPVSRVRFNAAISALSNRNHTKL